MSCFCLALCCEVLVCTGTSRGSVQVAVGRRLLRKHSSSELFLFWTATATLLLLVNKAALLYLISHIFEIKKEAVGVISKWQIQSSNIHSQGAVFKLNWTKLSLQQRSLGPGE